MNPIHALKVQVKFTWRFCPFNMRLIILFLSILLLVEIITFISWVLY